jgi:hypothetical protein
MYGRRGVGVDINGDGIPDVRVGRFGQVRPDVGMAFMGGAPAYGYGGMPYGGARVDVNGDGIPDVRVGPYGQVRPDVGSFVPPGGYGPGYYPPPAYY